MRRRTRRARQEPTAIATYPLEIEGLLDDVRHLRTTMASDLSAAAAAVDSDAGAVARDIIEGNRDDLAALGRRVPEQANVLAATRPAGRHRPDRRSAVRWAVVPIVAALAVAMAAAAAYAVRHRDVHRVVLSRPTVTAPAHPAAAAGPQATLRLLAADVHRGAGPATITADVARLRSQLASMAAAGDSTTLASVRRMLAAEERVLSGDAGPGAALAVIDVHRLQASVAVASTVLSSTIVTPPPAGPARRSQATPPPAVRATHTREPAQHSPSHPSTAASPAPTATTRLRLPTASPTLPGSVGR